MLKKIRYRSSASLRSLLALAFLQFFGEVYQGYPAAQELNMPDMEEDIASTYQGLPAGFDPSRLDEEISNSIKTRLLAEFKAEKVMQLTGEYIPLLSYYVSNRTDIVRGPVHCTSTISRIGCYNRLTEVAASDTYHYWGRALFITCF